MSNYGFGKDSQTPSLGGLKLPTPAPRELAPETPPMREILRAGADLGFVPREPTVGRRPGRRRTEAQDKISVAGAKRILDRFRAYCDRMDEPSYCKAIEHLLDAVEK